MKRDLRMLFIGSDMNPGSEVMKGVNDYCSNHGQWEYHLEGRRNPLCTRRVREAIANWKADGVIALTGSPQLERVLRKSGLPAVNYDSNTAWKLPTVIPDNAAIGRMVAHHFLDNGFRNFAFAPLNSHHWNCASRCDGFQAELRRHGFDADVFHDVGDGDSISWFKSYRRLEKWLLSLKKPVAIMGGYDSQAQEYMMVCRRLGLRIPDDVAIVGAGNQIVFCRMCKPPLSSIDPDQQRVGYEAARLLHSMIRGKKPPAQPIFIPPRRIVARQSSNMVAVEDPHASAAMRLIRDRAGQINVKDILQHVPVSRRTLEIRFEEVIGRTLHEEIVRVRMDLAKGMLDETEAPIKAVSRSLGFRSSRNFADFFRQHARQTPMQYRQKIQTQGMPWSNAASS